MEAILTGIEVENFKSFKGKVLLAGLGSPFTAIIGPNASGKSNLMDAIAFVMGDNDTDQNLSDLVFGWPTPNPATSDGSETSDKTSVTAFLKDNVGLQATHRFTRAVSADHKSTCYTINGNHITGLVYRDELEQLGISVKYQNSLIFQGSVESIASMKPKKLTKVFETISLSGDLKDEYDELLSTVSHLRQVVKDQQLDTAAYKKICLLANNQVDESAIYKSMQESIIKEQTKLCLLSLFVIEKTEVRLENEMKRSQHQLTERKNATKMIDAKIKKEKISIDDLSYVLTSAEGGIFRQANSANQKKLELARSEASVTYLQSELDQLRLKTSTAELLREKQEKVIVQLENDLPGILDKLNDLTMEKDSITDLSGDDEERNEELRMTAEMEHAGFMQNVDMMKEERSRIQLELDCANCKISTLETLINVCNRAKEEALLKTEIMKLHIISTESELSAANLSRSEVDAATTRCEQLAIEIKEVCDKSADYAFYHRKAQVVEDLKRLFPGVLGIVWKLCTPVEERHKKAYLTVFGSNLDDVIVDSADTAHKCILHLKMERVAEMTFLPLNELQVEPLKEQIRTIEKPSGVELLYDVLDFSEEIEKAVRHITNNTAVCQSNEDAEAIAFGLRTCNAVSMDGTLFQKDMMVKSGWEDLLRTADVPEDIRGKQHRNQLFDEYRSVFLNASQGNNVVNIDTLQTKVDDLKKRRHSEVARATALEKQVQELKAIKHSQLLKIASTEARRPIAQDEVMVSASQERIYGDFCTSLGFGSVEEMEQKLHRKEVVSLRIAELDVHGDRVKYSLEYEKDSHKNTCEMVEEMSRRCEALNINLTSEIELKNSLQVGVDSSASSVAVLAQCQRDQLVLEDQHEVLNNTLKKESSRIASLERNLVKLETAYQQLDKDRQDILQAIKMTDLEIEVQVLNEDSDSASSYTRLKLGEDEFDSKLPLKLWCLSETAAAQECVKIEQVMKKMMAKVEKITPDLNAAEYVLVANNDRDAAVKRLKKSRTILNDVTARFNTVKDDRIARFADCFGSVSDNIDGIYKLLTRDPTASAELVTKRPDEPYLEGLQYRCKSLQFGSRGSSIAALAMCFALLSIRPSPILVMDDVDASLDTHNEENLVKYILELKKPVIAISNKFNVYRHADNVVMVSIDEDASEIAGTPVSEVITLDLSDYPM